MNLDIKRPGTIRTMVLAVTIVFTALALLVGRGEAASVAEPVVGEPSPQTFVATAPISIIDSAATEARRAEARNNVQTLYTEDVQATSAVFADLRLFFQRTRAASLPDPIITTTTVAPPTTTTTEPPTTTTTEGSGTEDTTTTTEPAETTTTSSTTTTTTEPPPPPIEEQLDEISEQYLLLNPETINTMVKVLNDDFDRIAEGLQPLFDRVEDETLRQAQNILLPGEGAILEADLAAVRADLLRTPRRVFIAGLPEDDREAVEFAIADLIAKNLRANRRPDLVATDEARQAAENAVEPVTYDYVAGQNIVLEGERITQVHIQAIRQLDLLEPVEGPRLSAQAAVAAVVVILTALFLWRVAPKHWADPKLVTLFGLLIVLAALAARIPQFVSDTSPEIGFIIPAAIFGYLAAILFDPRTAVLLAVPVVAFTGLAAESLPLAVFAAGAAIAPIPFVSAVSSRTELRLAVLYSAVAIAPLAGAVAWFAYGAEVGLKAIAYGFVNGLVSGVVALGVLPFLENLFRITTTLTLLDLTDRNHPALRLIEEQAPGTFNHSILVGTLAGKAARAIDANPLLAQAAAYYHDLGKTVDPQFFIENQFGVSNPHDEMTPAQSAEIIRAHVTAGLRLARQYKIPAEVAQGILMHHGTGLMRFFYHKAVEEDPEVDPQLFRHRGQKPRAKEMAIIMLSDAVEGAVRALVQHADPTSEGIRKTVDQVVGEKVEDGQLDESSLTFGELTRVKEALVEALTGYYHTRIPYPGFPGTSAAGARTP